MHTLVAWHENINTAVMAYITATDDPHIRYDGDAITVPKFSKLGGVYAIGANMTQAQILSPSLDEIINQDIYPVSTGAEPGSPVARYMFHDYFNRPIQLTETETIYAQINQDAGAQTRESVFAWFMDEMTPIPQGRMRTIRCTNTTTLTAYAWTNGALTFSQGLPAGRYAVVGMTACSAGMVAARLVFPEQWARPGCIGQDAVSDISQPRFRYGEAGNWGEFEHTLPPSVDFFSVSADSAQTVHLDLVQVRSGVGR